MSKETLEKLWEELDEKFPGFVNDSMDAWYGADPDEDDYEFNDGLWCLGESTEWASYWNEAYNECTIHGEYCDSEEHPDCEGRIWDDSGLIRKELSDVLDKHGYYAEWNDAGTIHVHKA